MTNATNTETEMMTSTTTLKNSDEAIAAFNSDKPVWVLYSKPRATLTAIEKVTDGLVRITTINGDSGLRTATALQTEREPRKRATDSNVVNRRFFNELMKALSDD